MIDWGQWLAAEFLARRRLGGDFVSPARRACESFASAMIAWSTRAKMCAYLTSHSVAAWTSISNCP